ncbi:MAG: ACP S-malonyltransferase [Bacteroidota bacterium]|nr:ACP S-malonyltransferase [Candidatus Kapabacteria bacterium]MDW8220706.1 ACP S-malonyltransferase [Bacteroidota bacterium]
MATAFVFSGQGSQYVGMMRDLHAEFAEAANMLAEADSIMGMSLSSLCFDGPAEMLKETRYTQPALFVHEAILVTLLRDHIPFHATAGHSLGEYSALFAAGVIDFATGLRLVKLRGELMFRAGEQYPGTMAAVVGLDDHTVQELCKRFTEDGNLEKTIVAANFNSPGQVVISGSADYLRSKIPDFKAAGAKMVKELPVSGAFHSPLLQSAQHELEQAIYTATFVDAQVDVYANALAAPVRRADDIRSALVRQLTAPVLWTHSVQAMYAAGITTFYELGPGNVLQGLIKRTVPATVTIAGFDTAAHVHAAVSSSSAYNKQ